jgi:ferredoxin-NADP reductase
MPYLSLTIQSICQETADTKSFTLRSETPLSYQPGQFLTLIHQRGGTELRRQYSFSSHPRIDAHPTITVKRIPNGEISRWLFDEVKTGDKINSIGAAGFFTLPENSVDYKKVILLSAGSGITPVFSLLKEILHFHPHLEVVLIYSNRNEQSTIFFKELQLLKKKYTNRFTIEFLFSNAKNLRRARLGKYILEELLAIHLSDKLRTLAFICGPLDYRQMANITLLNEGLPVSNIRKEIFHTPRLAVRPEPPDRDQHMVKIIYQNQPIELLVQYPLTILQTAKEKGILLPYSCEAGRCGTCSATCIKGKVWMSRNEVLLDGEMDKGRVLTCTGYPIEGDVELLIN